MSGAPRAPTSAFRTPVRGWAARRSDAVASASMSRWAAGSASRTLWRARRPSRPAAPGAVREVRLSPGRASCRGELMYAHALQLFAGAAACVMTSLAVPELGAHALSLEELFAP